jgi:integrase
MKPALGKIKISDLTRAHIKRWHSGLSRKPYDGNRALAYLRKALSLAANDWELRPDNPALGIKMFPEAPRERFFSDAELSQIGATMRELQAEGGYAPGCFTAVRLLALTGMRLGEVLGLRWPQIDFEAGCARLTDAKTGARVVPLGAPVLAYLADLPRGGDYLCEAIDPTKPLHLKTFRRFWTRLRDRSGIEDARPHDFRHTAGTYTAQSGANAFVVRDVLGHKSLAMSGRYVGRSIDPLRTATDHFSNRVAAAMGGKPSADVVTLKPGKGAA